MFDFPSKWLGAADRDGSVLKCSAQGVSLGFSGYCSAVLAVPQAIVQAAKFPDCTPGVLALSSRGIYHCCL